MDNYTNKEGEQDKLVKFSYFDSNDILRYGLIGLLSIVQFLIIPIAVFNPTLLKEIENFGSMTGILLVSFAAGYFVDALKLYQISPKYSSHKKKIHKDLANTLGVKCDDEDNNLWFSMVHEHARKAGNREVSRKHAEWIMANHAFKLFSFSFILWLFFFLFPFQGWPLFYQVPVSLFVSIVMLLFSIRLFFVSRQERVKANKLLLEYAKVNAADIVKKISPQNPNILGVTNNA